MYYFRLAPSLITIFGLALANSSIYIASLATTRPAKKRPFVDENDDDVFLSRAPSPNKRNRFALTEDCNRVRAVSRGLGGRKTVLGEKRATLNIDTSTGKGPKLSGDKKIGHLKHSDPTKRALASPSLQRMARISSNRSQPAISSKSSDSGSSSVLFHKAVERARGVHLSSPLRYSSSSSDESDGGVALTKETMACAPESWSFEIYEDSHAETLQNLMEHSTTILDISDDSEDEKWGSDEISIKGKENISPERMAEIISGAANTRDMMEIDAKGAKALGQKREALGELDVEEFYPRDEVKKAEGKAMVVKDASEVVLDFNNLPLLDLPHAREMGSCPAPKLWASEGDTDDESDGDAGVPLTPPKGIEKQFRVVYEDDESAIEIECGASDKEN